MTDPSRIIDEIFGRFARRGSAVYLGEPVSLAAHMLQTAQAAERDHAPPTLIAAALLHDFGHLTHGLAADSADHGIDTRHEEAGAAFLARYFVPALVAPIRLHVAAKRYLCAMDPAYLAALSPASRHSLALQGGPFRAAEARAFAVLPHAEAAVRLRLYDDEAKVAGAATPDLEHYRPYLEGSLR